MTQVEILERLMRLKLLHDGWLFKTNRVDSHIMAPNGDSALIQDWIDWIPCKSKEQYIHLPTVMDQANVIYKRIRQWQ